MRNLSFISVILFVFYSTFSFAQLTADAGGDKHFCTYPDSVNQLLVGGSPTAFGGVSPYTYEWSIEPFELYEGSNITVITSYIMDDSTLANPNITDFTIRESFKLKLKVTDNIGEVAYDSCTVSFSSFIKTFLTHTYLVNAGDSIFLDDGTNVDLIFNQSNNELSYEWMPEETLNNPTLKTGFWASPDATTWYNVKITDQYGCSALGDPFYYIIVQTLGTENNNMTGISVYPNPASSKINIKNDNELQIDKVMILNLNGKIALQTQNISAINISNLSPGIYSLIILFSNGQAYQEKIVKL